jgi:site-specific DNA recombinase
MEFRKGQVKMKTCYIYLRVSTDRQAEEGFSLENQKKACRDYAQAHGYHVKRIFIDDGKSGRTTDRTAFQELLKEFDVYKADALIIYKIDRFARNVSDFRNTKKAIEAKGVEMISVLEGNITQGSSLIANILASVAEWESEVNGQRTRDALMQKYREGWQPTPPPIGYRTVGGEKERKTCEPDPCEAPIIKELFELYATGNYSILEVQDWLAERNIVSRNGTGLGHSVINTILKNGFYYGLIRWHGMSKKGNHVAIISKELFDTCQYVLAKHRDFLLRRRTHDFLLRGFAYCGDCGQRYTAEWHKDEISLKSRGGKIAYYHCQKRDRNGCPSRYVEMENLEKQVAKEFKKMQFSQEFIDMVVVKAKERVAENRKNSTAQRQALLNLKMSLENRRNKLEDNLLDGTIDRETYRRKHDEIKLKIQNVDAQIDELESSCNIDMDLIEEVLSFTRNIHQTYLEAPTYLKRHYMRFFYEKFEVKNKVVVKAIPTPIFLQLQANHALILKTSGLRD